MDWGELKELVGALSERREWHALAELARTHQSDSAPSTAPYGPVYSALGVSLLRTRTHDDDLKRAKGWFMKAAACAETDEELCGAAVNLAVTAIAMGDFRGALRVLKGWHRRNSGRFAWHVAQNRAISLLRLGRIGRSVSAFQLALALADHQKGQHHYSFVCLQEARLQTPEYRKALSDLEQASVPRDFEGVRLALLSLAYLRDGNPYRAIEAGVLARAKLKSGQNSANIELYMPIVYAVLVEAYRRIHNEDLQEFCRHALEQEKGISEVAKATALTYISGVVGGEAYAEGRRRTGARPGSGLHGPGERHVC